MTEPKIEGGYILLSRKLIESEIFDKPPLYLKVWVYLLSKAQHKDYRNLKRGQVRTSIPELRKACSWHIGYRKVIPTKDQIFQILQWMRSPRSNENGHATRATMGATMGATMITTTKATHCILITIDKYSIYQEPKNYEGNNESNDGSNDEQDNATGQYKQECNKNDKKNNTSVHRHPPYSEIMLLFNSTCTTFPKIKSIEGNRQVTVKNCWAKYPSIDFFKSLFNRVNKSDFLSGRDGKWGKCCFDWIMKPSNLQKIIEGNYDNKNGCKNEPGPQCKPFDFTGLDVGKV